jgi:shikimate dehydrogenase
LDAEGFCDSQTHRYPGSKSRTDEFIFLNINIMLEQLSGATRVHFIVGDPIVQVKAPFGVTQAFEALGHNAIVVPAHVSSVDLMAWVGAASLSKNVDGIIVTVPHKFACFDLCSTTSERAAFLRTVNTLRRNVDGTWHGDTFDGLGFVQALRSKGCALQGKKTLVVGAGGAGSAIAHALLLAGVGELAIHDADALRRPTRRNTLVERLDSLKLGKVSAGSSDPTGFDIVVNATTIGTKQGDQSPVDSKQFSPEIFIGCVITDPAVTPMIKAARAKGCDTLTGNDMFLGVRDLMIKFLLRRD